MRVSHSTLLAATVALIGCSAETTPVSGPSLDRAAPLAGFRTSQPAQARVLVDDARLTPIISSGDIMPGSNLPWGPVPDGLGGYVNGSALVLYANHEITAGGVPSTNGGPAFQFSRVSRLTIDRASLSVTAGDYVEDGLGGYIRFCSATWVDAAEGFPTGYFFAGEENGATSKGSVVVSYDKNGVKRELPQLGALSHENTVAVPGFAGKVVAFTTDDSRGQSELYMYVADDEARFIGGQGKLYVLKTDARSAADKPLHSGNLVEGQSVAAYFVEIQDPADLGATPASRYNRLQKKADQLGALPFVRLEDADYDRRFQRGREDGDDGFRGAGGRAPILYFVDTGSETVTGRTAVGADCGGVCDPAGSLYRLVLNPADPTSGATLTLMKRSRGIDGEWASPDNIATDDRGIMVMEDPAFTQWDGRRSPGIWHAKFRGNGALSSFREVVEATQTTLVPAAVPGAEGRCIDSANTCWETSGIISTAESFGRGTWLFVVQAHTLPFKTQNASGHAYASEGGQLLLLRLEDED